MIQTAGCNCCRCVHVSHRHDSRLSAVCTGVASWGACISSSRNIGTTDYNVLIGHRGVCRDLRPQHSTMRPIVTDGGPCRVNTPVVISQQSSHSCTVHGSDQQTDTLTADIARYPPSVTIGRIVLCCGLKGGVPTKIEKSDGCSLWILHTEKQHFGDNIWMYDESVPLNFEMKIWGDGRQWNRPGSKWNRKRK